MTRNILTFLMLVGLIFATSAATAQEKYTIQPRFLPGKYVQTSEINSDSVTRIGDLDAKDGISSKQQQTQKMLLEASAPDANGTQKMKMTFSEIKMNQTAMGMEMVYDSTDKEKQDPNLAPIFNAMIGSEITFDLTKEGKSENFKGFDELWDRIANSLPAGAAGMLEPMKESMSDQMLSNLLGGFENSLGKEPRAIGDTWAETRAQTLPLLGKAEIAMTHTLKSVKDDNAVIATDGKIKTKGDTVEMGPMKLNVEKCDLNIVTTTNVNTKTGLVSQARGETEMDLTAEMDMPGKDAPKMKMRVSTNSVSVTTMEKVN